MANVSYPGVYVEEISSGVRPIAAATLSIIDDETRVLPMAAPFGQPGRPPP